MKALFVLTSHNQLGQTGRQTGFYLSEAAHPWQIIKKAGLEFDFVSPQGGAPQVDGFNLEDPINKAFWEDAVVQAKLQHTLTPDQVNPADYQLIHYVGGHGTMWDFADNEDLAQVAAEIYELGGIVSAVCHGPAGLVNIKLSDGSYLVEGKKVAAFTDEEERAVGLEEIVPFLLASTLMKRGAIHIPAPNFEPNIQVDGRLITGQNPASAAGVGEAILEVLQTLDRSLAS
ncbi:MAG: type 1 glutamine amidotransferase domain-containing protein [Ardenticatenaceae bacterium]|nr:type 1 glutamine amidotransferase domain-containing protein [Ardenticatenaceae bacterium]